LAAAPRSSSAAARSAEARDLRVAAASVPGSPSVVSVAGSMEETVAIMNMEYGLNQVRKAAGEPQVAVRIAGALAAAN